MNELFRPLILIADDSGLVRKAMRNYLEAAGFRVSEAVDGMAAVEQACPSNPDVVVLDLAMPKMNGFDAARRLHQTVPRTHLVLFTSFKELVYRPEAPEVGIEAIVSKQDGLDALVESITRLLKHAA
jgi:DNA-binding NarL/FixJ family response regulator